ncbi:MAG: hypothetical protein H7061_06685 [Bdellovibrionaceae bacterium]|nr:hypothetical protein [Bdellovibrio sp.]
MKKRYLLTIAITVAVMILFFWNDRNELRDESSANETETQVARLDTDKKSEEVIKKQVLDSQNIKDKSTGVATTAEQIAEVEKSFSSHLKLLGQCLGVIPSVESDKVDPTFDNLIIALRPAFGDVVVKMDDWTQLDMRAPSGVVTRIRTETEYVDNGNPIKRLQYYKMNEQGMPELQVLPAEHMVDPSDSYLETLKGDAPTVNDEKGGRVYYSEGEELVLVERNNKVQSFSLSKGEKTFSCTETDTVSSNCQCL